MKAHACLHILQYALESDENLFIIILTTHVHMYIHTYTCTHSLAHRLWLEIQAANGRVSERFVCWQSFTATLRLSKAEISDKQT